MSVLETHNPYTLVYVIPGTTYGKIVRFPTKDASVGYHSGYMLIKSESSNINCNYGPGRNNESEADKLWNAWLDGPVATFIKDYGTGLVPKDIRWAVNDVEKHTGRSLTSFGQDEGAMENYVPGTGCLVPTVRVRTADDNHAELLHRLAAGDELTESDLRPYELLGNDENPSGTTGLLFSAVLACYDANECHQKRTMHWRHFSHA